MQLHLLTNRRIILRALFNRPRKPPSVAEVREFLLYYSTRHSMPQDKKSLTSYLGAVNDLLRDSNNRKPAHSSRHCHVTPSNKLIFSSARFMCRWHISPSHFIPPDDSYGQITRKLRPEVYDDLYGPESRPVYIYILYSFFFSIETRLVLGRSY
ncbi:hypothetical protein CEXT_345721 [Caerostris extrusa]|uniref:Uncharacterized protein n=1 Tax=Caerostris extrusa TaxID=172846 RepID=A0AAV4UY84_CAEEX|nr:hypothetical protein CEXT_345721 [Caerostris extrusa]